VVAIASSTFFLFRHRKRKSNADANAEKPVDVESPAPSTPNNDLLPATVSDAASHASSSVVVDGTVRRTTGYTQTFADWVEKTKEVGPHGESMPEDRSDFDDSIADHSSLPSFATPSSSRPARPVSADVLSLMSSIPKVSRAAEPPTRNFTLPPIPAIPDTPAEKRPGTRDSWGASSFRKAVLSAGGSERAKEILEKVAKEMEEREAGDKDNVVQKEVPVKMSQTRSRSYSGAWP
jgi:hypothetical protein